MERSNPFSTGSQFADWCSRNCDRCVKYEPEGAPAACEIDHALLAAQCGDGSVTQDIAERLGYVEGTAFTEDGFFYTWDCPERILNATALQET